MTHQVPREARSVACDASGNVVVIATDGSMWYLNAGTKDWKRLPELPPTEIEVKAVTM